MTAATATVSSRPIECQSAEQVVALLRERGISSLSTDSRNLSADGGFLAYPGYVQDGRQFVASALAFGVAACVVESHGAEAFSFDARTISLRDLKQNSGAIAAQLHDFPSKKLAVIAITGTNGKTSVALWIAQALASLDRPCGVVGTLGIGMPGKLLTSGLTTPDPVVLQQALRQMVQQHCTACAVEASSIGLDEGRMNAVQIHTAVFTNLTQDHLDYHQTMAAYAAAKRRLFAWPGLQAAVINGADVFGQELAQLTQASGVRTLRYGIASYNTFELQASEPRTTARGLAFELSYSGQTIFMQVPVIGRHNVENLLAVIGSLLIQGVAFEAAAASVQSLSAVPGRMQLVGDLSAVTLSPLAVVDYAHTPDALDKALQALRPTATARNGKLQVVFGCGGDRDPGKRPQMGAIAARLADKVVLTSDNPRSEDPQRILSQIKAGVGAETSVMCEPDRAFAIDQSLQHADSNDVILIAGKGHEDYQIIGSTKTQFDDVTHAAAALQKHWGVAC